MLGEKRAHGISENTGKPTCRERPGRGSVLARIFEEELFENRSPFEIVYASIVRRHSHKRDFDQ